MDEQRDRGLSGTWHNELGSRLILTAGLEGHLTGAYAPGVGESPEERPLTGFWHQAAPGAPTVVGFVVAWPASHSLTTWAGRHDPGSDSISASWLLVGETPADEAWRSTNLGHDLFSRGVPAS